MATRGVPRHLLGYDWSPNPRSPPNLEAWPYTMPAVAQIIRENGIDIGPGVTFLVGENGSGKSTLLEAFAANYPREGFLTEWLPTLAGARPSAEDSPLELHLRAATHKRASPAGFFLRAEAMHTLLADVDRSPGEQVAWGGETMLTRSHGESFLAILKHRFNDVGVYFLDEPESALSFRSCLGLVKLMDIMRREGSQLVVATHSPVLVSLPGATLLELDEGGIHEVASYDELALVQNYRHFMGAPDRFLRHLLSEEAADEDGS